MKNILFILLFIGLLAPAALAQNENIYLKQANQSDAYAPQQVQGQDFYSLFSKLPLISGLQQMAIDANQVARINIEGDNNIAKLNQTQTGALSNFGYISITNGSGNIGTIDQEGTGLLSVLDIRGSFNEMNVDQTGQFLQNYVRVTGRGVNMDILQNEDGIRLTQTGAGVNPIQIERSGQSIPIIIENN